jgi:glycosyltransferase involved in cell wall biosynthesis
MKLAQLLVKNHKRKPYDLVYQFSHIEMHALKKYKRRLPPIVLHPSVHAAGELQWHRKEEHLSRLSESWAARRAVRLLLLIRSHVQKKHIQAADYIISKSRNFAAEMARDYGLKPEKVPCIIRNPIDTETFKPDSAGMAKRPDGPVTFLFVSRIAVRKGTEMIVELSHRLADLEGKVQILVVGNHTLWSDYRGLLKKLTPGTAAYRSEISGKEMKRLYHTVDALIQPAHYEPFGNTVGEALACGLPVISSDKVGAAEGVHPLCCRIFPAGDIERLERQVRRLYQELLTPQRKEISETARSEAIRLFTNRAIVSDLIANLESMAHAK